MKIQPLDGTRQLSETEQTVLTIWTDVLQQSEMTVNDHFVDLGGDSLAAMLCITRLKSEFGIEFQLEDFFWDNATIAAFASAIEDYQRQVR